MKSYKHTVCLLCSIIAVCVFSCKKKSGVSPLSNTKLKTIDFAQSGGSRTHYRIAYDQYNNVDSIITIGGGTDTGYVGFSAFNYIGSSFTITDQYNNSYMVDASTTGQILQVNITDTLLMLYTGTELTQLEYKEPSSTYPYYTLSATDYNWVNGDIASFGIPQGALDSYSYNYSRPGQIGDALRISLFLTYGRSYIITTHLPIGSQAGATLNEQYLYQFDGSGRITQLTKIVVDSNAANDTFFYAYTYF